MTKEEALNKLTLMLEYRNDSPNTIKMYHFYLQKFFDTLPNDRDISSLTLDDAITYVITIKRSGNLSSSTLNLVISDIRTFYDLVLDKPLSKSKFPRLKYTLDEPYIFTEHEINLLFQAADIRMKAMIALGFDCGLRVSEVAKLKLEDIDSTKMLVHITDTKRNKNRYVKLSPFCLNVLRKYWTVYKPSYYLFEGQKDNHLAKQLISAYFHLLLIKVNITNPRARFHSLRATYATMMLSKGCDIFLLKRLLGHSSLASTARYIGLDNSNVCSAFSPTDN